MHLVAKLKGNVTQIVKLKKNKEAYNLIKKILVNVHKTTRKEYKQHVNIIMPKTVSKYK